MQQYDKVLIHHLVDGVLDKRLFHISHNYQLLIIFKTRKVLTDQSDFQKQSIKSHLAKQ